MQVKDLAYLQADLSALLAVTRYAERVQAALYRWSAVAVYRGHLPEDPC